MFRKLKQAKYRKARKGKENTQYIDTERGTVMYARGLTKHQEKTIYRWDGTYEYLSSANGYPQLTNAQSVYFYNDYCSGERYFNLLVGNMLEEQRLLIFQASRSFRENHQEELFRYILTYRHPLFQFSSGSGWHRSFLDRQKIVEYMRGLKQETLNYGQYENFMTLYPRTGAKQRIVDDLRKIAFAPPAQKSN